MAPRYGWAPKNQRARDTKPFRNPRKWVLLGALNEEGMLALEAQEGSFTQAFFNNFIVETLAPLLRPTDIVLMDCIGQHFSERALEAIEQTGARVCFLPIQSPEFNPIEMAWSKIKEHARWARGRTDEELINAIQGALEEITTEDAKGWFQHAGWNVLPT